MIEPNTLPSKRKSRIGLYAMPVLVAVLGIAVSVWWTVVTRFADAAFDHWLSAEASVGRQWSCATRSMAGFPFRIELGCEGLGLTASQGDLHTLAMGGFVAVANLYQPSLLLVESHGPLAATLANGQTLSLQWALMRSRLHFETPNRADQIDWAVDGLASESDNRLLAGTLGHAEFHMRKRPKENGPSTDLDLAASVADAVLRDASIPAFFNGQGTIKQGVILADHPGLTGVEAWRSAGGEIGIEHWDMSRGDQSLHLSGTLAIDETHRLAGKVDLAAKGVGELFKETGFATLGSALGGGSVQLPLTFAKGRLLIGPLRLAEFPPLY